MRQAAITSPEGMQPKLSKPRLLRNLSRLTVALLFSSLFVATELKASPASANQSTGTNSVVDYSLSLTGAGGDGSYLVATDNPDFYRGANSSQLIEAWVKPTSVSSQNVVFVRDRSFVVRASAGGWILNTGNGSSWAAEASGGSVEIGAWQHVAIVIEATQQRLYIDSTLVATVNTTHGDGTSDFSVGAYPDGNAPFAGQIDEVKIWVNKNQNDIPITMHTRASATDANLRAYWDFNEDSGTTVYNRKSGSVQNLELQGTGTRVDVKEVSSPTATDRVIKFPRTYLPGVGTWSPPAEITSGRVLVVAAGGAGGAGIGGGGGAGEVLEANNYPLSGSYNIVVGHGGVPTTGSGNRGSNSAFGSLEAFGGGGGGKDNGAQFVPAQPANGNTYGSGGGGDFESGNFGTVTARSISGVSIYANAGGRGSLGGGPEAASGGGGGAGGAGYEGIRSSTLVIGGNTSYIYGFGGRGGNGHSTNILGYNQTFGCGGGGGFNGSYGWSTGSPGSGGCPSAGSAGQGDTTNDGVANQTNGFDAAANSGSGGGGGSNSPMGGAGGSGIVVVRYTLPSAPSPALSAVTQTFDGFTFQIDNYLTNNNNIDYTWSATSTAGSAVIGSQGLVTVTGLGSQQTATVTVSAARSGYASGSATQTGTSLTTYSACTPTVSTSRGDTILTFATVGSCRWDVPAGVAEVDLLVVGGGGGAGTPDWFHGISGGAGGAGGVFKGTDVAVPSSVLITVGQGGSATVDGGSSSFGTLSAGGGGRGPDPYTTDFPGNGGWELAAGNGGGGNHIPGNYTRWQGGTGGYTWNVTFNGVVFTGRPGVAGTDGTDVYTPGEGGEYPLSERTSDITGTSIAYAAAGTRTVTSAPTVYGSGGHSRNGATSGVRGVVIVRFASSECTPTVGTYVGDGTNGTLNTNYRTYTFDSVDSCPWTIPSGLTEVEALLVAGGGGGGAAFDSGGAGGGGGGQVKIVDLDFSGMSQVVMEIGAGGLGGVGSAGTPRETNGSRGQDSVIYQSGTPLATALGGDGGARSRGDYISPGRSLGAGGAAATANASAQGGAMGGNSASATSGMGGGGGGSSGAGGNGASGSTNAAQGGAGTLVRLSGSAQTFGRGGNGSPFSQNPAHGISAASATGNGGGGARASSSSADQKNGGAGGSGLIILRAEVPPATYSVEFDGNTGSGTMASQTESYNVAFNLPSNGFTKSGFLFLGWNTKSDGTGTNYQPGDSVTLTGTSTVVTYYAKWQEVLSITTPTSGTQAQFNSSFSLQIASSGGSGGNLFTVVSGTLPPGLTMNSSGLISGTPTTLGSSTIRIKVQDSSSASATTASFTISVVAAPIANAATPTVTATIGVAKSIDVSWSAIANASFYTLKVYDSSGSTLLATIDNVVGVSRTITSTNFPAIADNTSYSISLTANASGNYSSSGESGKATVRTNYVRTVSYSYDGATSGNSVSSITYVEGSSQPTLPSPSKTGYTFEGWYREAGFTTLVGLAGVSYTPHATFTAFAKWSPNTYTLTFDSNGGSSVTSQSFLAGASVAKPVNPTKSGLRFLGWSTSETSNQGDLSARVFIWPYAPGVADRTLYAIWVDDYSVSFAGNSAVSARVGSGGGPELNVVPKDGSFTWEAWIRPESTGRTWSSIFDNLSPTDPGRATLFLADQGSGPYLNTLIKANPDDGLVVNSTAGSLTYNKWQHIAVSYERTSGAEGSCVNSGELVVKIYVNGSLIRSSTDTSFAGCLQSKGLSVGNVASNQQFNGQIDQVKVWEGALTEQEIQASLATFSSTGIDNTLRAHYSFDDLDSSPASGEVIQNIASDTGSFNLALFSATASNVSSNTAQLLNSYDVNFDGNGSLSGSVAAATGLRPFQTTTVPTHGNLLRAGYTFSSWNTQSGGGGTTYTSGSTYTTLYGDVTLYSQWSANGLAVTWNSNGGSSVASTTVATNAQLNAPVDPTRTGYTFAGWSTTNGGSAVTFPYTHGKTDAFTMYALWTANTLTLSFDSNGGSVVNSLTFLADGQVAIPAAPARSGYQFVGWSTSETSNQGDLSQRILVWPYSPGVEDKTLYAIWADDYSLQLTGASRVSARVGSPSSPVDLIPVNQSFTWEAWIYPTGVSGTGATKYGTILDTLDSGDNYGRAWLYVIDANATGPRIQVGYYSDGTPEEGRGVNTAANSISYNQWHHVAVTFERTGSAIGSCSGVGALNIKIYIDGVLSASESDSSFSRCLSPAGFGVGDNWDDANQQFKGSIDQVKVWEGALTLSEIQESRSSFGAGSVDNNLRAHYSFNDLAASPAFGQSIDNLTSSDGNYDLTLYASNQADVASNATRGLNSFDISFAGNDADSGSVSNLNGLRPFTSQSLPLQGDLLRAGYSFNGWNTAADGSGTAMSAGSTYLNLYGDRTFHADWQANDLTVVWDSTGGSSVADTIVQTDAALSAPIAPTRTGYTFDGWATSQGGTAVTFPYTHSQTQSFTMYAIWIPDVYTLTYTYNNADGGESRATDSYTVGTPALTLPVPTRTGYTFGGWYVDPVFATTVLASTYAPGISQTLYAKWIGRTYSVVYEYNGADGGAATPSDDYTSGSSPITLPVPTRTGYSFAGWFETSNLSGSLVSSPYTTSQNRTLYAKWTAIQYSVTYNPDIVVSGITYSGSGDVPVASSTYTIGQSVPVLPNTQATPLTRLGYTFLGWVTNPDGTGTALNSGDSVTMGSANINFYPKWSANTYSINYNLNGGIGSLSGAPTSYTVGGNSVTLPSTGFTKTGFNFLGWTKVQGGTTPISNSFSTFSDVTLVAIWELKTIAYSFDDGIANSASISGWPSNASATFGSSITLPDLAGTTATIGSDSYLFFGWEYQGSTYESGDAFILGETAPTFTAQWIQLFDVRYGFAGGTHPVSGDQDPACLANIPQLCTNSQVITLRSNPSRAGYTFQGWKIQDKATVKAGGALHTLRNDEYLFYAQWQAIDYTFSFNSVGGSNNFDDLTKNIGQVITMPNPGQKPGHSFAGWSANGSQSLLSSGSAFVVSTASVSFDAVWVPDVYTVVFDWQGALGAPEPNATYTYGTGNMALPSVGSRIKDGFNFAGWSTAPGGPVITNFQPIADDVLYAIWTDGSYSLTFAPKGGTMASTSVSVPRGDAIQLPTPVRTGFVFTGWFDQAAGGNFVAAGGAVLTPSASRTFHARWVQRSLHGVDLATLETSQEYTASGVNEIDTTITHNPTGTSARVQIPAGSLPSGTKVNVRFFRDTERQEQLISDQNSYIFSIMISWLLGSGDSATVPNTDPDKPIVVTLNNSDIKAGAMIYRVVGDEVTELGRATQNGTVTVELYEDPEIVIALTPPSAPTSIAVTPGDTEATITWTAPLADGGIPTASYTVTASPGGQTCTWTSGPLTCRISGLTNGVNYTFSVVATNRLGNSLAASNSGTPSQPSSSNSGSVISTGPAAGIKPVTGKTKIWTKRLSANQVKVYIKYPEMGVNYQVSLQKNDGDYVRKMSKTINTTSDTDLRVVGESYYLVRTIELPGEGRYRIQLEVDSERLQINGKNRPAVYKYLR